MDIHTHVDDPDTSRASAVVAEETADSIRERVLQIHREAGALGLTEYELNQRFPHGHLKWVWPRRRRAELFAAGLIGDSGMRRLNPETNHLQVVWVATEIGIAAPVECCPTCHKVWRSKLPPPWGL